MANDLTKLWGNFSLSAEESEEVEIQDHTVEGVVKQGKSCLVGKLIADRTVSKDTIRSILMRGWRPSETMAVKVLGDNLFLVEFMNDWDKVRVLEGRPWVFEGNLFSVVDFDGGTPPSNLDFEKVAFWVRMFRLPLACMGKEAGFQIGSSIGVVEEVDTDEEGVGWGEFLRVRIQVELTKPLPRGRVLKYNGNKS